MIEVLIAAVPLLVLLGSLLLGHYPGCDAIVRLSERISSRGPARSSAPTAARRPAPPRSFAPGGGLLIAFGLAQRPPPLAP
jgi:hypothetical protein